MNRFLLQAHDCMLMIIDIQERLFNAMEEGFRPGLVRNARILLEASRVLDIPVLVTEQNPRGLGETIAELSEQVRGLGRYEKITFSCWRDAEIRKSIEALGRPTVIIAGIEAHVCVFQTALDLLMAGYRVAAVSDAVCSRRASDRLDALREIGRAGALVYSTEMIVFMLLERAGTTQFRKLAPFFK